MSGSSGGGYVPSVRTNFDCDTGVILTNLSSIDITVLVRCSIGDILHVRIEHDIVIVEDGNGEILGSVVHANVVELKECIEAGSSYAAKILNITGTSCRVKIQKV